MTATEWTIVYTAKSSTWAEHMTSTYLEASEAAQRTRARLGYACRYTIAPSVGAPGQIHPPEEA